MAGTPTESIVEEMSKRDRTSIQDPDLNSPYAVPRTHYDKGALETCAGMGQEEDCQRDTKHGHDNAHAHHKIGAPHAHARTGECDKGPFCILCT